MNKNIEFGIGFLAGRPNVCNIINCYYKEIIKQTTINGYNVNFNIFILLDLKYQKSNQEQFYDLNTDVHKHIKVNYITPQDIQNEKDYLVNSYNIEKQDIDLILGDGYARARNSIMYFALKNKIDYLLFWDDDEYPIANIKSKDNKIIWEKQNNILEHLKNIINSNVTVGYRCGNMSPIPLIEFDSDFRKRDFKKYIEAISNEAITWEKVKTMLSYHRGIKYADARVLKEKNIININNLGTKEWLLGSGICINLKKIDEVPPFYNPPEARGEDAFFSTWLTNCKVLQVPTYHFHDGFLKYTNILDGQYPTEFLEIKMKDDIIIKRFLDASIGWIKYKPLLTYISRRSKYKQIINETKKNLQQSIFRMNKMFNNYDFSILLDELEKYDTNVEKHYEEYIRSFEIWTKLKNEMKKEI